MKSAIVHNNRRQRFAFLWILITCFTALESYEQRSETSSFVPKIIHQTWKTNKLPENLKFCQESFLRFHRDKGWEYRLWDDVLLYNFVNDHCPSIARLSYNLTIQFVDAARYCVLYHVGGIFVDLDYQAFQSLDYIFSKYGNNLGAILTIEPPNHARTFQLDFIVSNAVMFARKNSKFFKKVIQALPVAQHYIASSMPGMSMDKIVMHTTGPLFLSHISKLFLCNANFAANEFLQLKPGCDYSYTMKTIGKKKVAHDERNKLMIIANHHHFSSKSLFTKDGQLAEKARCVFDKDNKINTDNSEIVAKHHWCGSWWQEVGK